jgi:hypothetical protein
MGYTYVSLSQPLTYLNDYGVGCLGNTESMDVDGQGETHNLGHDVEREDMHTINCRPQWAGKLDPL